MARDHDPGDAVPPGVAPVSPVPLSASDREVLHELERFGSRQGRAAEMQEAEATTASAPPPGENTGRDGSVEAAPGTDGEGI